jgi:hypothetical protein
MERGGLQGHLHGPRPEPDECSEYTPCLYKKCFNINPRHICLAVASGRCLQNFTELLCASVVSVKCAACDNQTNETQTCNAMCL